MKTILLAIFCLSNIISFAGPADTLDGILPLKNGRVFYSGVLHADSLSQAELHMRVQLGLVDLYRFDQNSILINDKEAGVIVVRCSLIVHVPRGSIYEVYELWHTLRIYVRDEKLRYEISDFEARTIPDSGRFSSFFLENYKPILDSRRKHLYESVNQKINLISTTIEKSILQPPGGKDW